MTFCMSFILVYTNSAPDPIVAHESKNIYQWDDISIFVYNIYHYYILYYYYYHYYIISFRLVTVSY